MSRAALAELLQHYPWAIREQILGYSDTIRDALPSILAKADIRATEDLIAQAELLAAVRKLWTMIDGQYSILRHSLSLMSGQDVSAVSFGSTYYSFSSQNYRQVESLRNELRELLIRLEIFDLVSLQL